MNPPLNTLNEHIYGCKPEEMGTTGLVTYVLGSNQPVDPCLPDRRQIAESTIRFSLLYPPGESHLAAIRLRAESALEQNIISALPDIAVAPGAITGFHAVILTTPAVDRPFWFGFYLGLDFCRNNRDITVGRERGGPRGH